MTNAYKIANELNGASFDYGDAEEKIGFVLDNYYEAMAIYRCIAKRMKEVDEKRTDAHQQLQKLRDDEDRWKQSGGPPQNFDADAHQRKKDRLIELREKEYDIFYRGSELPYNKLTHVVKNHLGLFKTLERLDCKVRKHVGWFSSVIIKTSLWPMRKTIERTIESTNSSKAEDMLKKNLSSLNSFPDMMKDKIVNP